MNIMQALNFITGQTNSDSHLNAKVKEGERIQTVLHKPQKHD